MSTYPSSTYPSPRVKICGITNVEDAIMAADAGADAIGLVFYQPSPRYVEVQTAKEIIHALGSFVTVVGLFVDESETSINDILDEVPLHVLQFHGHETASFCKQFQRAYIKALRMKPELDVVKTASEYTSAAAVLLDAYRAGVPGGTGEVFDWARVPQREARIKEKSGSVSADQIPPIILAGGLTPDNIQAAVQQTRPYAVDVSGGVECSPGKKDTQKVVEFIQLAKTA